MTNHQAFRKFCHFLRKTGYYKKYWQLVYKIGLSKNFIKKEVNPSEYICRLNVSGIGIITQIKLQEKQIEWMKELNPPKRKQLKPCNSIPDDILRFLETYRPSYRVY
jgi:CRISPR/Cas system-associated protein endoribonuclease Cas2